MDDFSPIDNDKMRWVAARFVGRGSEEIAMQGRKFIKEGWICREVLGSSQREQLKFFLFNDCIVCARPLMMRRPGWYRWAGEDKVELEEAVSLVECMIRDAVGRVEENGKGFVILWRGGAWLVEFRTRSEAVQWRRQIDMVMKTAVKKWGSTPFIRTKAYGWRHMIIKETLWAYAMDGEETKIKQTFQKAASVGEPLNCDMIDEDGSTPLHVAAAGGQMLSVHVLFHIGANINAKDATGCTPLHVAVLGAQANVVSQLLRLGADPQIRDHMGWTPLATAIKELKGPDAAAVVTALCRYVTQASLCEISRDSDYSMLGLAVKEGCNDALFAILNTPALRFEAPGNREGRTPLMIAVSEGKVDAAIALLDARASVSSRKISSMTTPLHIAAASRNFELVGLLLAAGAQPNAVDFAGRTALHVAFEAPIAQELARCGSRLMATDSTGVTAISSVLVNTGVAGSTKWLKDAAVEFANRGLMARLPSGSPCVPSMDPNLESEGSCLIMEDSLSECCLACSMKFNIANRRHHCRRCGILVCAQCSTKQAPVPPAFESPQRVCDGCFNRVCALMCSTNNNNNNNNSNKRPKQSSSHFSRYHPHPNLMGEVPARPPIECRSPSLGIVTADTLPLPASPYKRLRIQLIKDNKIEALTNGEEEGGPPRTRTESTCSVDGIVAIPPHMVPSVLWDCFANSPVPPPPSYGLSQSPAPSPQRLSPWTSPRKSLSDTPQQKIPSRYRARVARCLMNSPEFQDSPGGGLPPHP